jgi:hypothetical protein
MKTINKKKLAKAQKNNNKKIRIKFQREKHNEDEI